MKRKRYTEQQIAFALRQTESGTPVAEVTRKMGISEQTFYRWKKKFAGMRVAELRRLKQLEEENKKLKQLVADLNLVNIYGQVAGFIPRAPLRSRFTYGCWVLIHWNTDLGVLADITKRRMSLK